MKILFSVLLFSISYKSCDQLKTSPAIVNGTIIHRSCATIAVQVLDETHYNLGQASWQQGSGQPVFEHVFSVANQCSFPAEAKVGEKIKFAVLASDSTAADCMLCELWDNPPKKKQLIKVIK
ncbi:hypothetical protein [Aridibaculum aurantiacum]|uniref:hypothetical protein n=1 Tax=Aridibaculum aurantiacum TaxID=2810307 RepID=UPI001A966694|nr:hypothetical protein [Aridibaculum aurantiacum]